MRERPQAQTRQNEGQDLREMCNDTEFCLCQNCKRSNLKVKPTKFDTLFIACTGYPNCKTSMNLPKGISKIEMLQSPCSNCGRQGRCAKLFRLTFDPNCVTEEMANYLPDNRHTSGQFCIFQGCDDNLGSLSNNNMNGNFKRMPESGGQEGRQFNNNY